MGLIACAVPLADLFLVLVLESVRVQFPVTFVDLVLFDLLQFSFFFRSLFVLDLQASLVYFLLPFCDFLSCAIVDGRSLFFRRLQLLRFAVYGWLESWLSRHVPLAILAVDFLS